MTLFIVLICSCWEFVWGLMPIHRMALEDHVFVTRQVGYVDHVDNRMWSNALSNYANSSDSPLMALLDVTDVDRLCPTILKVVNSIITNGNVLGIAIVTGDLMASRNANILSKLSQLPNVRVFSTYEDALRFADGYLHPTIGNYGNSTMFVAWAI